MNFNNFYKRIRFIYLLRILKIINMFNKYTLTMYINLLNNGNEYK
jgi:hypothetical protein